jgi:hypothetical protein
MQAKSGAAARIGAQKLGVTGKKGVQPPIKIGGGKLGPLKKQIKNAKPLPKAEAKANARGLKAANKPTNKIGSKADRLERKIVNKNFNAPAKTSYVKQLRREAASKKK